MIKTEEETEESLRDFLKKSGILEAYEALLLKLLANGPPRDGNIFSYAADQILAWQAAHLPGNGKGDSLVTRTLSKKGDNHNDFVNNSVHDMTRSAPNGSRVHNKTLDKLKGPSKVPSSANSSQSPRCDSDSDTEYDFQRSTSIVRVTQPQQKEKEKKSALSINTAIASDEDTAPSTPPTSSAPRTPKTPPSSILLKTGSGGKGASVSISETPLSGNGNALPRSNSTKGVSSIPQSPSKAPSNIPVFSAPLPRSESNKSIGSNNSNSPTATPRGVDLVLARSESNKSIGSNHSNSSRGLGIVLPRSVSNKSMNSEDNSPLATPRSQPSTPISRSESAKTVETSRDLPRVGSGKSLALNMAPSGLPRSVSNESLGSNPSGLTRSDSAKSISYTPRSPHPPSSPTILPRSESNKSVGSVGSPRLSRSHAPPPPSTTLPRSESNKSVGSSGALQLPPSPSIHPVKSDSSKSADIPPSTTSAPKNRPFLFTITTDDTPDTHTLLHEASIPHSPHPTAIITKNPSLTFVSTASHPSTPTNVLSPTNSGSSNPFSSSTRSSSSSRPLPLGSLAQTPAEFSQAHRRGSIFTEKDLPQPDIGDVNLQIEHTYGSDEEEEEILDDESPIDSDEEEYRDDFEAEPAMSFMHRDKDKDKDKSGLRRSSIFEEIANIKPPIQFDEGIEDSCDIEEPPNESILSHGSASDNTGEFDFDDVDESETLEVFEEEDQDQEGEDAEELDMDDVEVEAEVEEVDEGEESEPEDDEDIVDEFLRGMEKRKESVLATAKTPLGAESERGRADIRIDLSKVYGNTKDHESPKDSGTDSSTAREAISESARGIESWRSGAESDRPPTKDTGVKGRRRSFTIPYETLDYSPAASPKASARLALPSLSRKKTPRSPTAFNTNDANGEDEAAPTQQLSAASSYDSAYSTSDEIASDEPGSAPMSRNPSSESATLWDPNKSDSDEENEYHRARRGVTLSDEEDIGEYESDLIDRDLDVLDYLEFKKSAPKQRVARTIEEDEFASD